MKHIYLFISILICGFIQAQIINFPDVNFKAKLLQSNSTNYIALDLNENSITLDQNADGEIEVSEIQNTVGLNVNNSSISDLAGISSFTNLKWLRCSNNSLTTLVIDNAIVLNALEASHNSISTISVHFDDEVYSLDLSYNSLTDFTLENSSYLESLYLNHNQISSLVISNTLIDYFDVSFNNLSQIQFTGNVLFYQSASFTHNQFALLDLSDVRFNDNSIINLGNNLEDKVLFDDFYQPGNIEYTSNNSAFDLGNFHMITSCDPEYTGHVTIFNSPNLQNLIFKNGVGYGYYTCNEGGTIFQNPSLSLQISNCPNLEHVCVDEGVEQTMIQARINQLNLQSQVVVDSNCTSLVLGSETFAYDEPFTVSPVPAQSILQIKTRNSLAINNIEIYNNLGQIVQRIEGYSRTIDVSKLSIGSYFLKIKTQDGFFVKQFLKE